MTDATYQLSNRLVIPVVVLLPETPVSHGIAKVQIHLVANHMYTAGKNISFEKGKAIDTGNCKGVSDNHSFKSMTDTKLESSVTRCVSANNLIRLQFVH